MKPTMVSLVLTLLFACLLSVMLIIFGMRKQGIEQDYVGIAFVCAGILGVIVCIAQLVLILF